MTPAAFIHARRKARRISLIDLGAITEIPVGRLAAIEGGSAPVPYEIDAISFALDDGFDVLADLVLGRDVRLCVACGCHEHDACLDGDGAPCSWASEALCSHCVDPVVILGFDPAARPYVRDAA